MRKFFNTIGLIVNLLFVVALLMSGLAPKISPEKLLLPAYFGLLFPFLLIANVFFVLFWLVKMKWFVVFSLLSIIAMYENVKNVLPLKGNGDKKTQTDSIIAELKVLSYNVKLFDFYKKNDDQEHFNQIVNYIMNVDADVVCLQEFGYYNMKGFLSQAELLAIFSKKYKYNHLAYKLNSKQLSTYGVATFSKYPIIEENEVDYDAKYNFTIYSDIKIDKKIIRVYNCHLESNQLTVDDKKEMYKLIDDASQKNISETTGRLTRKLGVAYKKRAYQAMQVAKSIQQSPHDVFVCGDFNDSPVSYAYTKIKGDLSDAFVETSQGMGITYNEPPFLFRIDYILHSKALSSKNFKIDNVNYSDHYPISCIIN